MPSKTLLLSQVLADQLLHHGRESYPEECCGVLLGLELLDTARGDVIEVTSVLPARNVTAGDPMTSFEIDPEVLLQAHKQGRPDPAGRHPKGQAQSAGVIGYYHSHPSSPAVPSPTDHGRALALSHPGQVWIICSGVENDGNLEAGWSLRAWSFGHRFEEMTIRPAL